MITNSDIIYYSVYLLCTILSFFADKSNLKGLGFIKLVLIAGLINELCVEVFQYFGDEENLSHFIYIPIEYLLLCMFYSVNTTNVLLKKVILMVAPLYLISVTLLSIHYYNFSEYPSMIYNLGCFFSIIWISILLYKTEFAIYTHILRTPVFWILAGLLIFYSGVFFFNTAYKFFINHNAELAGNLRVYINVTLNCILYISWSYSFICSIKIKKYIYR